jgi:hypothetical protein
MNVASAIPSSPALASLHADDYIAEAIPAGAPLPPNAVLDAGREYTTRKHLRATVDEANGVTVAELEQSKKRKTLVEAASVGGDIHETMLANHATMMANHAAVMALLAPLAPLAASVARNSNNIAVRLLVSEFQQQALFLTSYASCCILFHTQRNVNAQRQQAWTRLQVETAYVAPAAGVANAAPPIVGSVPPNQPANRDAALGMTPAEIDALGTSFNVVFVANPNLLHIRIGKVVAFYTEATP